MWYSIVVTFRSLGLCRADVSVPKRSTLDGSDLPCMPPPIYVAVATTIVVRKKIKHVNINRLKLRSRRLRTHLGLALNGVKVVRDSMHADVFDVAAVTFRSFRGFLYNLGTWV